MENIQFTCQFFNPETGERSHPFGGDIPSLLGSIEELRNIFNKRDDIDDVDAEFDKHFVLVITETVDGDTFVSRRPLLNVDNFRIAISSLLNTNSEESN